MDEDIIEVGQYEVHPTIEGGWAVVSPRTGEVLVRYATQHEAIAHAEQLDLAAAQRLVDAINGYHAGQEDGTEMLVVEEIVRMPAALPAAFWPGGATAGKVRIGCGPLYLIDPHPRIGEERADSVWVVFPGGVERPHHIVRYNGRLDAQQTGEAVRIARAALCRRPQVG